MPSEKEQKEILDALKLISHTCSCYDTCGECPFGKDAGGCHIQSGPPCEWNIQTNQTWRAMK